MCIRVYVPPSRASRPNGKVLAIQRLSFVPCYNRLFGLAFVHRGFFLLGSLINRRRLIAVTPCALAGVACFRCVSRAAGVQAFNCYWMVSLHSSLFNVRLKNIFIPSLHRGELARNYDGSRTFALFNLWHWGNIVLCVLESCLKGIGKRDSFVSGNRIRRTSPEAPWTMSWPSIGPLSDDPSPLRGILNYDKEFQFERSDVIVSKLVSNSFSEYTAQLSLLYTQTR